MFGIMAGRRIVETANRRGVHELRAAFDDSASNKYANDGDESATAARFLTALQSVASLRQPSGAALDRNPSIAQ